MAEVIARHAEFILSSYDDMAQLRTPYEVYALLKATAAKLGYSHYAVLHLPKEQDEFIRQALIATNWPPELIAEYDRHKLLASSAIMSSLRAEPNPVLYDVETMNLGRSGDGEYITRDLFVGFGIPRGVYFPSYNVSGGRGAIGFMGDRPLPGKDELAMLHLLCHYAFGHMHFLLIDRELEQPLKPREIECLEWAARGKTNGECAALMQVSETTISGYFAAIGRKLSAFNKTHMVAIAYERGLIHPQVIRPNVRG